MAVACLTEFIRNVTVDEIIIVNGQNCIIHDVIVIGNIEFTNTEAVTIVDSEVSGNVRFLSNRFTTMQAIYYS